MENAKRAQQRLVAKGYSITPDGQFGKNSYAALMSYVGQKSSVSPLRSALGEAAAKYFPQFQINTALRIAHALAQQSVETRGFDTLVESLNYTVAGLRGTFSKTRISDADCQRLGRNPPTAPALSAAVQEEIANLVYGGDWGKANLGNDQPGDGWHFRGRGAKQTTGRTNYGDVLAVTGIDVIADPALIADPDLGMRAAGIYWQKRKCNTFADKDDIDGLTRAINGGINGLPERTKALARAKEILL
jgi:putative chitinase